MRLLGDEEHYGTDVSLLCLLEPLKMDLITDLFADDKPNEPSLAEHLEKMEKMEELATFSRIKPIPLADEFVPSDVLQVDEMKMEITKENLKAAIERKKVAIEFMVALRSLAKHKPRRPLQRRKKKKKKRSKSFIIIIIFM